jgi:hypothetical protein
MDRKFKFLRSVDGRTIKSQSGNVTWKIGEWQHFPKSLVMCSAGLHCSPKIIQALSFVSGEVLAEVETRGTHLAQTDKEVWSDMRIIKAWHWTKEDSLALAIYAAELVLPIFEKQFPKDNRPRKAISAARMYLQNPTTYAAEDAAEDAAWAARAARAAARAAAWAAEDAARAAEDALTNQIETWLLNKLSTLKEVTDGR